MTRLADDVLRWLEPCPDPVVEELARRSRRLIRAARWDEAATICQNAIRHAQQNGDTASQAHALAHHGRVHQALKQFVRTRECYRQAINYFHLLDRGMDEAAVLTLLADAEQAQQHMQESLLNFQQAVALVELLVTRQQNSGNLSLARDYAARSHRLQRRIERVAGMVSRVLAPVAAQVEWVPILAANAPLNGDLRQYVEGAVCVAQILIENRAYELRPITARGSRPFALRPGATYYALPVREDGWAGPDTYRDDYILVRRVHAATDAGLAAAWYTTHGLACGRFVRAEDGTVTFTPLQAQVIGGDAPDAVVGYVEAILRPAG